MTDEAIGGPWTILRRAAANMGLLLSSKGGAALMQLATLALAARTLGQVEFGFFALLLSHVQILSQVATLQSNQAIVHYGVRHLAAERPSGLQTLLKAATLVDFAGAMVACAAAVLLAPIVGQWLDWPPAVVGYAQWLAPLALANSVATPKGVLRLFARFDWLALHNLVTPAVRLGGGVIAFLTDAPLAAFIVIWLVAGFAGAGLVLAMAWGQLWQRGLLADWTWDCHWPGRENPGLGRFLLVSNLHSTMALAPGPASVFIVGAVLGPAAAGLFRIAREIATALGKPADLLNQTLYPDLARLAVGQRHHDLSATVLRGSLSAGAVLLALLALAALAGPAIVSLLFGAEFKAAGKLLVWLLAGTCFTVLVAPLEPAFYAMGWIGRLIIASLASNGLLLLITALFTQAYGLTGAGWASAGCGVTASLVWGAIWWHGYAKESKSQLSH